MKVRIKVGEIWEYHNKNEHWYKLITGITNDGWMYLAVGYIDNLMHVWNYTHISIDTGDWWHDCMKRSTLTREQFEMLHNLAKKEGT